MSHIELRLNELLNVCDLLMTPLLHPHFLARKLSISGVYMWKSSSMKLQMSPTCPSEVMSEKFMFSCIIISNICCWKWLLLYCQQWTMRQKFSRAGKMKNYTKYTKCTSDSKFCAMCNFLTSKVTHATNNFSCVTFKNKKNYTKYTNYTKNRV